MIGGACLRSPQPPPRVASECPRRVSRASPFGRSRSLGSSYKRAGILKVNADLPFEMIGLLESGFLQYSIEKNISVAFLGAFLKAFLAFLRAFIAFLRLFSGFYLVKYFSIQYSTVPVVEISPPDSLINNSLAYIRG